VNRNKRALLFFLDGVGLGGPDPDTNPFVSARLPNLTGLLGEKWYLRERGAWSGERASLAPTDAALGVPGRPQSATGQATILTGRNVPQLIGEHYGPKPNAAIAAIIQQGTLFQETRQAGGAAALLTPYPQRYFDSIKSGRRLYSSIPLAATAAGLSLMTAEDLRAGRAVSPDFTGDGWRHFLGYADIPLLSLEEAGRRVARLARQYQFSFFEHWPTDRTGHRGRLDEAVAHLELLDAAIGGLVQEWDDKSGLLIITSDHGNIEEKEHRQHTLNPVPTILVGQGHHQAAATIFDLTHIAPAVRAHLEI
jgi:hypothetical protein